MNCDKCHEREVFSNFWLNGREWHFCITCYREVTSWLGYADSLREFLGAKQSAVSGPPARDSSLSSSGQVTSAEGFPPSLLPFVKKESENAYKVVDDSILDEEGKLEYEYYKALKDGGWAYSPAKKVIWKPK